MRTPNPIIRTPEDARKVQPVGWHCGVCGGEADYNDKRAVAAHVCKDPAGKVIDVAAIRAARQKAEEKTRKFTMTMPDCEDCGLPAPKPEEVHRCFGSNRRPDPGSLQALENVNRLAELAHDLKILGYGMVKDDGAQ